MSDYPISRIITAADGSARRPKPGDRYHFLFIRGDGWTLAAPMELYDAAYKLWPHQWTRVVEYASEQVVE